MEKQQKSVEMGWIDTQDHVFIQVNAATIGVELNWDESEVVAAIEELSLDTDITIHLYDAGKEELLFKYFDKCYMHEFILEREIKNKSLEVYNKILEEIEREE